MQQNIQKAEENKKEDRKKRERTTMEREGVYIRIETINTKAWSQDAIFQDQDKNEDVA